MSSETKSHVSENSLWPETTVTNWEHFTKLVEAYWSSASSPSLNPYLYRGQANCSWKLLPSLIRDLPTSSITPEQALVIEDLAFEEFTSQAHLHLPQTVIPSRENALAWWTLIQHYNGHTRVIDWTASPYVAVYFAVLDEPKKDGVVWLVNKEIVTLSMLNEFGADRIGIKKSAVRARFLKPDGDPLMHFILKVTQTDRMVAQRGSFSVCEFILGDHEEIIASGSERIMVLGVNALESPDVVKAALPQMHADFLLDQKNTIASAIEENDRSKLLNKLIIPSRRKTDFLRHLKAMNVTAASLFPGADGLGRSVNELIRLEADRFR